MGEEGIIVNDIISIRLDRYCEYKTIHKIYQEFLYKVPAVYSHAFRRVDTRLVIKTLLKSR